tara:strand:- start:629 stop:859 length:231 start_codon:yes stop_codon:yes gene_type:complete
MLNESNNIKRTVTTTQLNDTRISKMMSLEWLGQTVASGAWIVSVFVYGLASTGDYLQLVAASAWMLSNIAAVVVNK